MEGEEEEQNDKVMLEHIGVVVFVVDASGEGGSECAVVGKIYVASLGLAVLCRCASSHKFDGLGCADSFGKF